MPAPNDVYTDWGGLPPADALGRMLAGHQVTRMLHVAAALGIADLVSDDPKMSDELARLTPADPGVLRRLLRGLVSLGVLTRSADGRFGLTPVGQHLRSDTAGSLRAVAVFSGEAWHQRAWMGLLHSVKTGEPAFDHEFGVPISDYLAAHPTTARRLDERAAGDAAESRRRSPRPTTSRRSGASWTSAAVWASSCAPSWTPIPLSPAPWSICRRSPRERPGIWRRRASSDAAR